MFRLEEHGTDIIDSLLTHTPPLPLECDSGHPEGETTRLGGDVGSVAERFWDEREHVPRPVAEGDPHQLVFRAFVPHAISGWVPTFDEETWRGVDAAQDAVRALEADHTQGSAAPAEWLLRRAESAASSTIEGVRPSARRLARAEAQLSLWQVQPRSQDSEALRNIEATEHALRIGSAPGPVTMDDIFSIHRALMGEDHPAAGQIRSGQNWIGSGFESTPLNAQFVPPPPEAVPALMDDLVECINAPVSGPLVHTAVVHAQFEAIHPFADGNGRTGRALIHLMLRRSGLTASCTLPISASLARRRDDYIRALNSSCTVCSPNDPLRSAAAAEWTRLLSSAAIEASYYARRIIDHVAAIRHRWLRTMRSLGVRRSNAAVRLIETLPARPVLNADSAAAMLDVDPRTARRSLDLLVTAGILVQRSAGKRNRVFEAVAITDAFAALASINAGDSDIHLPPLPDASGSRAEPFDEPNL